MAAESNTCPQCGAALLFESAKFCGRCGERLQTPPGEASPLLILAAMVAAFFLALIAASATCQALGASMEHGGWPVHVTLLSFIGVFVLVLWWFVAPRRKKR